MKLPLEVADGDNQQQPITATTKSREPPCETDTRGSQPQNPRPRATTNSYT
jgi:hypothetical protein